MSAIRGLALGGLALAGAGLLLVLAGAAPLAAAVYGLFGVRAWRRRLAIGAAVGLAVIGLAAALIHNGAFSIFLIVLVAAFAVSAPLVPAALLAAVTEYRPDVAVVDVRLPPTYTDEGLRAATEARGRVPGLPVLVLSQYVEQLYARELMADGTGGIGYLLKDRVFDSAQFTDAVRRVAAGGTAMDPEVIARLLTRSASDRALATLSPRETEVLALMAEGRSNAAIAARLVITERAVAKHTASIFQKLTLQPSDDDNRRVLAVLAYLNR